MAIGTTVPVVEMERIPAGANPFHHDLYHCGSHVGFENELLIMYDSARVREYLIICDYQTGRRFRVNIADLLTEDGSLEAANP